MPRSKEISEDLRRKVVDAHEAGKGYKTIAKNFDLHRSTVRQIVHRWKKFNTIVTRPRSGRPTKTTQILLEVTRNVSGMTSAKEPDIESLSGTEGSSDSEMCGDSVSTHQELADSDMRNKTHDPSGSTLLIARDGTTSTKWIPQYCSASIGAFLKDQRSCKTNPKDSDCPQKQSTDTGSLVFDVPNNNVDGLKNMQEDATQDSAALKPVDAQGSQEEEMLWCDICNKYFHNETELETHQTTHLEETPLECEECGEIFDSGSELEKHKVKKHGKMRYPCEICGSQYNYRSQYIIHQRAHTGEKPFCCNECGQAFGHKSSLVIHQRKHTGNTAFKCHKCGKLFDTEEALEKHSKLCFCAKCKKCFTGRALRRHMQTHT